MSSTELMNYGTFETDGWEETATEASDRILRGQLLKFADWRWTYGQDSAPLREGTRLVAIGVAAAWVKWVDGKPAEHRLRKPGARMAEREELGDLDKSRWEKDSRGDPRDPWQNTRYVYFLDPVSAEAYTYSTSSMGGRGAVIDLGDQIARMRTARPGAVPVVELGSAPMQTRHGKKSKPLLKVVDWVYGSSKEPAPKQIQHHPAREPSRGDMQDDMPF